MSNTKAFIDYSMQDNGAAAREALYAEIHDRVMSHIEQKKMELAGGMLHAEEKSCDYDDMKSKMKKAKKKVKKLKEELSLIEAAMCDGDNDGDDEDYKDKKRQECRAGRARRAEKRVRTWAMANTAKARPILRSISERRGYTDSRGLRSIRVCRFS